ncbi:hypothetical protein HDU85_005762 [Gaertneriomyces sp. JEL0708]|nr:hypothetical protein HDU85_005762 [Gaertneriomyces sp. JEL0708]
MASTSVAFFSGDQSALELANFIGKAKGEPENGPLYESSKTLLSQEKYTEVLTRFADESKSLLSVNEKDFEPVYNLLIALIKDAQPEIVPKLITSIIAPIEQTAAEKSQLKLKVLSNLYNILESNCAVRYDVYAAIWNVAAKSGDIDILIPHLTSLDTWIAEWGVALNKRRALYLLISQKLEETGDAKSQAYELLLKYLSTFDNADDQALGEAKEVATRAVKEAIKVPSVLSFEDLFRLRAVQALKPSKIYDLLKIFLEESLKQYEEFVKANPGFVEEQGLNHGDNLTKMRLLSMATLAGQNLQSEISYDTIAASLNIPADEIEIWIIDVIRAGLMDGKMNQLKRTVSISRSVNRVFTEQQWVVLKDRLDEWKKSLQEVLRVVGNAKLLAGSQGVTIETTITA